MRDGERSNTITSDMFYLFYLTVTSSRDLAVIVASMAYNTWFTKLYCKDLRIVSINASGLLCCKKQVNILNVSFCFPLGIRGDRAGPSHSQQILQPGGDHSGERRVKIVSFDPSSTTVQSPAQTKFCKPACTCKAHNLHLHNL